MIVTSGQVIIGARLSSTVTTASHVDTLLLLSVTVRTTAFVPTSEQSKSVCDNTSEAIPQASFEPLSNATVVVEPAPAASNCTVTS